MKGTAIIPVISEFSGNRRNERSKNLSQTALSNPSQEEIKSAADSVAKSTKLSFKRHEGYLYKHVRTQKFFQFGNFNLRFFVLDVPQGILIIRGSLKDKGSRETIHFRDIIKVLDDTACIDDDKKCSWQHIFVLFTHNRPYRLYAQTLKSKLKWIQCFQEIIFR